MILLSSSYPVCCSSLPNTKKITIKIISHVNRFLVEFEVNEEPKATMYYHSKLETLCTTVDKYFNN